MRAAEDGLLAFAATRLASWCSSTDSRSHLVLELGLVFSSRDCGVAALSLPVAPPAVVSAHIIGPCVASGVVSSSMPPEVLLHCARGAR